MIQMQVWGTRAHVHPVHTTAVGSCLQRLPEVEGRQLKCPVETSGEGHRAAGAELCQLTRQGNEQWMKGKSQGTDMRRGQWRPGPTLDADNVLGKQK